MSALSNESEPIPSALTIEDTANSHTGRPFSRSRPRPRPRPRPVLSCLRCRSRKIKCDRLIPCKQCTSTGHDRECSYNYRSKSEGSSRNVNGNISRQGLTAASVIDVGNSDHQPAIVLPATSQGTSSLKTLISLQERLQKLEQLCATQFHAQVKIPHHENVAIETSRPLSQAEGRMSIKTSGPRYHSESYKKSLLHHFGIASRFCLSGFDDPERAPVMNELRMFHERYTKARRNGNKVKAVACTLVPLLESLPPRTTCDEVVSSYFSTFEKSLRILHYPSFMGEYQRFWESEITARLEFNSFVSQLAAIVAIVHAWKDVSPSGDETAIKADVLCGHVETWLDRQTGRQKLTLATLRTRTMLVLAQQVRSVRAAEVWEATGTLLRSAMTAGLHRDPSEFADIPIFEGELRRRLWMTIIEMDLGASLSHGMPVMLHDGDFTCNTPSNVDDIDLFDGMTELPPSKPLEESTDSIFQVALAGSLTLRLQSIGGTTSRLESTQANLDALEKYIRHLPSQLHLDSSTNKNFSQTLGIVLLNMPIRRVLSYLYRSSISWTGLEPEAITTGLQSSLTILSYQKVLDPETWVLDNGQQGGHWDLFYVLFKSDLMQAALDVSLHAQIPGLVSWTRASLLLAVEDTISGLVKRISRNGSDIKDILRLTVIFQLLKSQITQTDRESMMREGVYNVLMACRRAARQDGIYTEGDGSDKDIQPPSSPNTQLVLEQTTASIGWPVMPNDPSLDGNNFASYFDTDNANFYFLSDYTFENVYGDVWSNY